jgi:hypothetical protein
MNTNRNTGMNRQMNWIVACFCFILFHFSLACVLMQKFSSLALFRSEHALVPHHRNVDFAHDFRVAPLLLGGRLGCLLLVCQPVVHALLWQARLQRTYLAFLFNHFVSFNCFSASFLFALFLDLMICGTRFQVFSSHGVNH